MVFTTGQHDIDIGVSAREKVCKYVSSRKIPCEAQVTSVPLRFSFLFRPSCLLCHLRNNDCIMRLERERKWVTRGERRSLGKHLHFDEDKIMLGLFAVL